MRRRPTAGPPGPAVRTTVMCTRGRGEEVIVGSEGSDDALVAELREITDPIVTDDGADLVEIIVKGHPGSRVVRVVVDAEGGVDVERIARLARAIGTAFDDLDPISGRYTLQVTSPGVDRPLVTARDFARNVGRPVHITPDEGEAVDGVVVAAGGGAVTLEVDGEHVEVPLGQVRDARVKLPW